MRSEQRGGQESLQDVRARLTPEKQKALADLIELETKVLQFGTDAMTTPELKHIGTLRRELTREVGGGQALDKLVKEAYGAYIVEGRRKAHERTQKFVEGAKEKAA